jgi:hypothetical protein
MKILPIFLPMLLAGCATAHDHPCGLPCLIFALALLLIFVGGVVWFNLRTVPCPECADKMEIMMADNNDCLRCGGLGRIWK